MHKNILWICKTKMYNMFKWNYCSIGIRGGSPNKCEPWASAANSKMKKFSLSQLLNAGLETFLWTVSECTEVTPAFFWENYL